MENAISYGRCALIFIGGAVSSFLGGWDMALNVLVLFVALDYITGMTAAYAVKALNSRIGFVGILRKIMIFVPVAMAFCLDQLMGQEILRNLVIFFYIANEGLSILENAGRAGVKYPDGLKEALAQLNKGGGKDD